jgi:outer membrane protein TolC
VVDLAVEEGELAPIASDDNRRSIVERETALVQSERGLEQAAIALSLYWRDPDGQPLVPGDALLPGSFPAPRDPTLTIVPDDVSVALERRPELRALALEIEALELERDLGKNRLLPQLDVGVFASQDIGASVNDPDDPDVNGPFELELGFVLDVPLQRRSPRGALRETEAKLNKLRRELQFAREVAAVDVRDAVSALTQSWRRLEQARENVELARRLAEAERVQLEAGESDLFRVNVREQQAAVAAAGLVDVLDVHFRSLARYTTVLGVPWAELATSASAADGANAEPIGG